MCNIGGFFYFGIFYHILFLYTNKTNVSGSYFSTIKTCE